MNLKTICARESINLISKPKKRKYYIWCDCPFKQGITVNVNSACAEHDGVTSRTTLLVFTVHAKELLGFSHASF